jgi:hypothetical protein
MPHVWIKFRESPAGAAGGGSTRKRGKSLKARDDGGRYRLFLRVSDADVDAIRQKYGGDAETLLVLDDDAP